MDCPFCRTVNRDEADSCYHCKKDLSMLRLVVNKAKSHFNAALEYAERDRVDEAIGELQNALDLDSSHVNSHVVLGTLYAKKGLLDKAEEQWNEALKLDQRFEKAHGYLEKMHTVRTSLPIVRRQRILLVTLLAAAALFAAAAFWAGRPDPLLKRFNDAAAAYDASDYKQALATIGDLGTLSDSRPLVRSLRQLAEVIKGEEAVMLQAAAVSIDAGNLTTARGLLAKLQAHEPSDDAEARARALEAKIAELDLRQAVDAIGHLIASNDLRQADARLQTLLATQPALPQDVADQAIQLRAALLEKARTLAIAAVDDYAADRADREVAQRAIATAAALAGESPTEEPLQRLAEAAQSAQERLARLATEKDRTRCLQDLDAIEARLRKGEIDLTIAARALVATRQRYPEQTAAASRLDLFIRKEEQKADDALTQASASGATDAAAKTLESLASVLATADPTHAAEKMAPRREQLAQARAAWTEKRFREAVRDGQWATVLELAPQVLALPNLDDTAKGFVQASVARAQTSQARARWEWMLARDYKYEEARVSPADAELTVKDFDLVSKHLSRVEYPKADADLFFYAGISQYVLGKKAEAVALFDRVLQEYPKSGAAKLTKKWRETAQGAKAAPASQ